MKSVFHSAMRITEHRFAVILNKFLDSRMRKPLVVFLVGFTIEAVIIASNPIVFGVDTIVRLLHRDRLVIGHWLTMLQVLIFAVTKISTDPRLVRYTVALIGASAGVGYYRVVEDQCSATKPANYQLAASLPIYLPSLPLRGTRKI